MKILLPGGTGQLGQLLVRALTRAGHECVILTRDPARANARLARHGFAGTAHAVHWDGRKLGPWVAEVESATAIINLAGRSVDCRYTEVNLAEMRRSRVEATQVIGAAIAATKNPPRVWLNASTATIYAHATAHTPAHNEIHGLTGGAEPGVPALWKRSVDIGLAWEDALFTAPTPRTRRAALRAAMVMDAGRGGVFDAFATLGRLGVGHHGSGDQFVSWIHEDDFVAALMFLLAHEEIEGRVNLAAPDALPNRAFIAALHRALGRRLAVPIPVWLLEIGALVRRTETELLLKSRRVAPARLLAAGFRFHHPTWPEAARDLTKRWRAQPEVC